MRSLLKINFIIFLVTIFSSSTLVAKTIPLEEWAKRADVRSVTLSPNGEKLAMLRIMTTEGMPVLEVYDANDLRKRPFRMDSDPMEIVAYYWATDDKIVFETRQKVRDKIDDFNQGVYEFSGGILTLDRDPKKSAWKKLNSIGRGGITSTLPKYPSNIIISGYPRNSRGTVTSRSRIYYNYNIKTGRKKVITRESEDVGGIRFDEDANPRFAFSYDGASNSTEYLYRGKDDSDWKIIYTRNRAEFEEFFISGFDPENPDNLLVIAHNGNDKRGLWSFDPKEKKFKELIYRRSDGDVLSTRFHSNRFTNSGDITAVSYYDGRELSYEWFNGEEKAIYDQLKSIIPYADRIGISSRSRDGNSLIISNRGPRDPGTYYLVKNGELKVIGSTKPGLMSKELADVEAITYDARDGKKIRGFITIPNSQPPYPLVVMPHGGPFVGENPSFNEWAQMLANRGFMVLQPQYRGSKNFGLDFYKTAFINGGQGGYQMQDDKDDGALYLVEKGLVDPNRMMMFGWSYGGYASLVAAARDPQIYQCVIAGATVPDPIDQVNYYRNSLNRQKDSRQAQEQLNMWVDSVSPIKEVSKVNIPMLIVHGDVDQRTPPRAARKYMKALKKHDKDHKVLWLEGADHFSDTLFYHHKIELYTAMTDYLANDCFKNSNKVAQR